jgi:hypothetical protein
MLELLLMPQLHQTNQLLLFQPDGAPAHVHNKLTALLKEELSWAMDRPRVVHFLSSAISGLCERCGLRSASAYDPQQLEG